jgi:hypothetical protein
VGALFCAGGLKKKKTRTSLVINTADTPTDAIGRLLCGNVLYNAQLIYLENDHPNAVARTKEKCMFRGGACHGYAVTRRGAGLISSQNVGGVVLQSARCSAPLSAYSARQL